MSASEHRLAHLVLLIIVLLAAIIFSLVWNRGSESSPAGGEAASASPAESPEAAEIPDDSGRGEPAARSFSKDSPAEGRLVEGRLAEEGAPSPAAGGAAGADRGISPDLAAALASLSATPAQGASGAADVEEEEPPVRRRRSLEEISESMLPAPLPRVRPEGANTRRARELAEEGLAAWRAGDIRGALATFREAVDADPEEALARRQLGRLLLMMAVHKDAWEHLRRSVELRSEDPRAWLDLTSFFERTLQMERAAYARQRAEELGAADLAAGESFERNEQGFWLVSGDPFP